VQGTASPHEYYISLFINEFQKGDKMEQENNDSASVRINVRIPRAQYEMLKNYGRVLGLDTDSACLKHFLTIGLQSSAGTFSNIITGATSVEFMKKIMEVSEDSKSLKD